MELREAEKKDLPGILRIWNHFITHTNSNYDYEVKTIEFINDWYLQKIKQNLPLLVIADNENVAGYASYGSFRPHAGFSKTVEHGIYISPNYPGKGFGKILMNNLIIRAKTQGYHTMLGVIDAENTGSVLFHQKYGFKEVGRMPQVGYKSGQWLDCLIMQLILL